MIDSNEGSKKRVPTKRVPTHVAMWLCSKIPKFKNSKKGLRYSQKMISYFQRDILRYSQTIISCFQVDIGPIFKISKIFLDGLHHLSVPVFSKNIKIVDFRNSQISKNNIFLNVFMSFLVCLKYFVMIKCINTWFQGFENQEIIAF